MHILYKFLFVLFISRLAFAPLPVLAEQVDPWQMLKNGEAVAIMRHALAPGTGDPSYFDLKDCATQRNLSEQGRDQARKIGALFMENGISQAHVLTSQWCRCRETAELLGFGSVTELPLLNSFFGNFSRKDEQTSALRSWLADRPEGQAVLLVTHQVNITAFTDIFPQSGEILIVEPRKDTAPKVLKWVQTLN